MDLLITEEQKKVNWSSWGKIIDPLLDSIEMTNLSKRLKEERKDYNIFPNNLDTFNAFSYTNYNKIRIVLIGPEPYATVDTSHGLAYSSIGTSIPNMLKNIFSELYENLYNFLPENEFEESFSSPNLTRWATQGIFLLNRILTVREGEPGSHTSLGWEYFTDNVIKSLNDYEKPLIFLFWGDKAKRYEEFITNKEHLVLTAPLPTNDNFKNGFFGCKHFRKANNFIITRQQQFEKIFVNYSELFDLKKFKEIMMKNGVAETTETETAIFNGLYQYDFFKTIDFRTSNY